MITCRQQQVQLWKHWRASDISGLRPKTLHPLTRVVVERSHASQHAALPERPRALADGLILAFRGTASTFWLLAGALRFALGASPHIISLIPFWPSLPSLESLSLTVSATGYVTQVVKLEPLEPGRTYRQEVKLEEVPPPATPPVVTAGSPSEGRDWTSPTTGMEFVWIEALKMWVGKYEVTNAEYRKKEAGHNSKEFSGHSLNGDRQPVVNVNFDDAKAYAEWMTQQDRRWIPLDSTPS